MHLVQTMAYVGEKPWHGLGNKLASQQPIEAWKQQAGMDWQIEESEVRFIYPPQILGQSKVETSAAWAPVAHEDLPDEVVPFH